MEGFGPLSDPTDPGQLSSVPPRFFFCVILLSGSLEKGL